MDKLRALQYFAESARTGSFSGASRELGVSVPAVARLVGDLESSLRTRLFERSVQGLTLTSDGHRYLQACMPALHQLALAHESLLRTGSEALGTLVLSAPSYITKYCILPHLPEFHARFPEITLDIRAFDAFTQEAARESEVLILVGWQARQRMIQRKLAQTRSLICASPSYWQRHGMPARPRDLAHHQCLLFRDQEKTILDLWEYERDGERESVTVRGWMVSDNRDVLLEAAIAGEGVGRFSDLSIRKHLSSGELVPALPEWDTKHAPPINLFYRSTQRKTPRVRHFIEFAVELFESLERDRLPASGPQLVAERPHWYRRRHGWASATPQVTAGDTPQGARQTDKITRVHKS